jgi:DNA processing protein
MDANLKYWMALNRVTGLGPVKTKKLLDQYGSAKNVCETLRCPVPEIEQDFNALTRQKIGVVTIDESSYPVNLRNIHDPPPILYVKGKLIDADKQAMAIVGTRKATRYGLEMARSLSFQLARAGLTVISGLALGIDTAAHEGALEAGGRTIAVLGSGIDQVFPIRNRGLAQKIEARGALISEFPLGQAPDTWTFPQRNRIISGLALGVVVVEGHYDSGAMITAKLALDQGREVFAVPGPAGPDQSKGPHWLIKQGAKLVESVEDILEELRLEIDPGKENRQSLSKNRELDLSDEENRIAAVLTFEPKHLDTIALETAMAVPQVSSLLMMLELKKAVRQLPGKMFVLY